MSYVYLIKSKKDESFYTGITSDVNRRLLEHNRGKLKVARFKKPWILWYVKSFPSTKEARFEEKYLKKKNREFKNKLKNI